MPSGHSEFTRRLALWANSTCRIRASSSGWLTRRSCPDSLAFGRRAWTLPRRASAAASVRGARFRGGSLPPWGRSLGGSAGVGPLEAQREREREPPPPPKAASRDASAPGGAAPRGRSGPGLVQLPGAGPRPLLVLAAAAAAPASGQRQVGPGEPCAWRRRGCGGLRGGRRRPALCPRGGQVAAPRRASAAPAPAGLCGISLVSTFRRAGVAGCAPFPLVSHVSADAVASGVPPQKPSLRTALRG